MQPTASPAPDVSISQDLRHAASVLSKFYEELPVILTRLFTAGAAIIIGLLLLRLFRRLLNKHLRYRPGTTRRTMQQVETLLKHGSRVEVLIEQGKVTIVEIKRKMRMKE